MYERIAVPLDGSHLAFGAIGPARRLARVHAARLELVIVVPPGGPGPEAVLREGRRRLGESVETRVIEHTNPARALADYDASDPLTLLCMTTCGGGAGRRALIGSTALSVVEHSPYAVVLIGPRCDLDRATEIDRIIVCLDGTSEAESVIAWVISWCTATSAKAVLLRVTYPMGPAGAGDPPSADTVHDLGSLQRLAQRLETEHDGLRVEHITVPHERPADAIEASTRGHDDAMLAVTSSHPGRITQLLLGSTAADVVRHASVPVLITSRHGTEPPPW